jgi:hypothetical protein
MATPSPDNEKRDVTLPAGCKDLADIIKANKKSAASDAPKPRLKRLVFLPDKVSVKYLAEITGASLHTMTILMQELQIVGEVSRSIDFEDAAKILRDYGILAKRGRAA